MIPSNILQSMLNLNARTINELQEDVWNMKAARGIIGNSEWSGFDVAGYNDRIRVTKKRAKILERNQRAMKAALMEAYEEENFQRAVKMLVDDLFSYPENLGE